MSAVASNDFTLPELERLLSRHLGIHSGQLAAMDFPKASYAIGDEHYWTSATLRPWIEAAARARLAVTPGEIATWAQVVNSVRHGARQGQLKPEAARDLACRLYGEAVATAVLLRK